MENIVSSFQLIVERIPDQPAVICGGNSHTYQQLDQQSNLIATFLANRELKGRQVGVAMERGWEWIIAMLGIWKAGATYVPLDLNCPLERLETIIADCEIALVIRSHKEDFRLSGIPSYFVDEMLYAGENTRLLPLPEAIDRAYIMYTSGTSGEPKGVQVLHHQAVRMSQISKNKFFKVVASDRMLQLAGLNFSVSLVESLTGLLNGICLVIATEKERHNPELLIGLIEREQVSSALIPPAMLGVFPKVSLPKLKILLVGGEGVAVDVMEYWRQGRRMLNAYGFTENTVLVTSCEFGKETPVNDIGTLIPGAVAYVLDEELNQVPNGKPGEFCIAGPQLSIGYWNRPELNKQKFIRNPFITEGVLNGHFYSRIYRSGDKVIRLANGHFLYLGRMDNQVKIRGMRIELSEIEQCLNRYPGVSLSVVMVKEHAERKLLVAYLQTDKKICREKIVTFIAQKLPDYMRPAYYVTLPYFPLTINRKIDKSKLPDPDWDSKEPKEKPVTSTEKEIAEVWCRLLGVSTIGRYDNFVSLGGDSISVLLMLNALEQVYGIRLKVEDVFSRPNLHKLALFIEKAVSEPLVNGGVVVHQNVYTFCPLTPALRNLWCECTSSVEMNEGYKLALFFNWDSGTKIEMLQKAWNKMVEEQEAMRIFFPTDKMGEPRIQVAPFVYADFPLYNSVSEADFWEKAYTMYAQPFCTETGPLHRVSLYRLSDETYKLVVIIHHLVTDGWSVGVCYKKLRDYYQCALKGIRFPVEEYSYRDYVMWNLQQTDKATVALRGAFWKQYLSGCPTLIFEGKRNCRIRAKEKGRMKYIPMDGKLVKELEAYCSQRGVTSLVVCLSVFQLLLLKYTGQTDFAVGLATTDRKRSEFQNMLGYFVSLLPVRVLKSHGQGLDTYVDEMMSVIVKLMGNALPLNRILERMMESTDRQQESRFIRFAFGLEESPSDIYVPEEWVVSSSFDMALIVHKSEGNYSFHCQYATACFDEPFIVQFVEGFGTALQFLLKESSRSMLECPLLTEREITERISSFSFSRMVLPSKSVVAQLEETATEKPALEAYCWDGYRVNYGELNRWANRVAVVIWERIAMLKQEMIHVGILLKNKKYLLPAIMGVLKSGGCYVPLDNALPIERLLFILNDAVISLLIVDDSYNLDLPCETVVIGKAMESNKDDACHEVVDHTVAYPYIPTLEDTAYIIYTSGSTGTPKGTPVSHRSLALFAQSQVDIYRLLPGKRVLQYASVVFDASVMEIFPALISEASLVIPTEKERKDGDLLLDLMEKERVNCALIPPALLAILPYRLLPYLQTLLVGGESTPFEVMVRWMNGRKLVNAYGPTENTVVTTCTEITGDFFPNDIGRPLPGVSCYVLDRHLTLLPDNVPGELYIGGLQLTTGYINRKELNREMFIDNPFVTSEDKRAGINTRLYKSGDRVMRTVDGRFLFLGRNDSQVKIRGFRIEPEEIARQLEAYPGIRHAIVLLKRNANGKQLIAYLLVEKVDEGEMLQLVKIRTFLEGRLPYYMIPVAWAILDKFPLTVNGKIDYGALPETELLILKDDEPPLGWEEEVLVEIAAKLLQIVDLGVCADLLDRGMSSLQAMELVHNAREKNVTLTITDVYQGRNIRKILANRDKSMYFQTGDSTLAKPFIILVCGYPSFKPFYDRFVNRFKDHYLFFVFESFRDCLQNREWHDAKELVAYYSEVVQKELKGQEVFAVAGHCLGGELGMMLAEKLRTNGYPFIQVLMVEGFIRRNKNLLIPILPDEKISTEQSSMTNELIESMPELVFGGKMIVFLAERASDRFMFDTDEEHHASLTEEMRKITLKNWDDWNELYPQALYYRLAADHWRVFDDEPLSVIYEVLKKNWNINESITNNEK